MVVLKKIFLFQEGSVMEKSKGKVQLNEELLDKVVGGAGGQDYPKTVKCSICGQPITEGCPCPNCTSTRIAN